MYGSDRCYKHKDLGVADDSRIEQIRTQSVMQNKPGSQILFSIDGNDFFMPSKNIEGVIEKISKAKKFWTVELELNSNEFIQYAIDNEELEHWNDSKMLESTEMNHERALSTVKRKITDPNLTAGSWWEVEGGGNKIEDAHNIDSFWNFFAIPVSLFFVFLFIMSFIYNSGLYSILDNITGELCCYGLMAVGGMGASISRTKEGRFE